MCCVCMNTRFMRCDWEERKAPNFLALLGVNQPNMRGRGGLRRFLRCYGSVEICCCAWNLLLRLKFAVALEICCCAWNLLLRLKFAVALYVLRVRKRNSAFLRVSAFLCTECDCLQVPSWKHYETVWHQRACRNSRPRRNPNSGRKLHCV